MTRIVIKQLIWDEFNKEHIKKHNVSIAEVEKVAKNTITHQRVKDGRYLIIGRIHFRMLSIIISRKGTGKYYPVTARDAARKERRYAYKKEKKQTT